MRNSFDRLIARLRRHQATDSVEYQGLILPAHHLRTGGPNFAKNDYYWKTAVAEADRLIQCCQVSTTSRLLDVGCGSGRLAIGLLSRLGEMAHYQGIDVDAARIQWCSYHITARHPGFQFLRIDVQNDRYNPNGQPAHEQLRLPFGGSEFDTIYLYSVFSHMTWQDVQRYLAEFHRLLKPGGRIFLTAFVEEHVPDVSVNPKDYRRNWEGPLHCVSFDKTYFETLLAAPGFHVDRFDYGQETDGQSAYYISNA